MLHMKRHVSLAEFSTFQIGGPADFFVEIETGGELIEALEYAKENELRTFVFSGGSNLLIADQGFRGLVIRIGGKSARVVGEQIFAAAGVSLATIVDLALENGLQGIEQLAGIPGSLGGAIRGNAGAFGAEIGNSVTSVKCYDRKASHLLELNQANCRFGYRMSIFKTRPELVILSATLTLRDGDRDMLQTIARETVVKREAKHSQKARCAGSFFMNPVVNDERLRAEFVKDTGVAPKDDKLPAGWLIDHVGLRGKKIGGAMVSEQHPNYFVNCGNAKADEVVMLASLVKQRVRTELGVQLKEEVQFVGF